MSNGRPGSCAPLARAARRFRSRRHFAAAKTRYAEVLDEGLAVEEELVEVDRRGDRAVVRPRRGKAERAFERADDPASRA
jgi:hypothetical protein